MSPYPPVSPATAPPAVPPPPRPRRAFRVSALLLTAALTAVAGAAAASSPDGVLRTPTARVTTHNAAAPADGAVQIDPALSKQLRDGKSQDFVIELGERADLSAAAGMDWDARGRYVYERLRETADRSQASLRRALDQAGTQYEAHWIKNVVLVRGGDAAVVRLAAAQPGVKRIRNLPKAELIRPEPGSRKSTAKGGLGLTDNIAWIGADQVWAQGTRGNGVTVGVIDSGATHTHAALRRQYRGWRGEGHVEHDYNWFEPVGHTEEPHQTDPHGNHVTGIIVGDDHASDPDLRSRIGVAPGAQWISCMAMPIDGSNAFHLLACGEFMLAPTRTDGSEPRPDLRPQVVNNSWSQVDCNGDPSDFYAEVVEAWVAAGIFPVFAAGNTSSCGLPEPPGLSTVSSPASLPESFAVGSSGNHDGEYAAHSLWGPTTAVSPGLPSLPDPRGYPQLKPQVVAPGVDILSAFESDEQYGTMTGTSMSAPHIAGLAALMMEAGDCLVGDYATLGTLIMSTARPVPYASGGEPAPGPGNVPNYATGWGEIDAPAAVAAASAVCGPQGFISGHVTDTAGQPIEGATVELSGAPDGRIYTIRTDADGSYSRRVQENLDSGYVVRVSAYGYLPSQESGVTVRLGQTTPFDVQLAVAPLHKISGRVRDAATGWPLHARLRISGYAGGALWTDPVTGQYSVRLPAGAAYRIDVDSGIPGYVAQTRELADVTVASTQDFALTVDAVRCEAPGYGFAQQLFLQDFESANGAPPTGWSATSAGTGWDFGSHAELHTVDWRIAPRAGQFAASIEKFPGEGQINDGRLDYLVSPAIDLRASTSPVLRFASYYFNFFGPTGRGGGRVQVSRDDGATWDTLDVPTMNMDPLGDWRMEAMDMSAYAGSLVRLRFHYDDGSTDEEDITNPGWAIDDVSIGAQCVPPAGGGLVIGHVRDGNTGTGLDGATVRIAGGAPLTTRHSVDPGVGAGFFAGWAPAGNTLVEADRGSHPAGYGTASETLAVTTGSNVSTTLALGAGRLRTYPASGPDVTVQLGETASVPFTLRNTGTLPLRYALEGEHIVEHFDVQVPPSGWNATDNGFGCGWSANVLQNFAGGDGVAAEVYAYECEGAGRLDNSLVLPVVDLSASASASLGFFLAFAEGVEGDTRFDVEASTDGGATWTSVFSQTENTYATEPFHLVEIDLSGYVGHANVNLRMRYQGTPPYGRAQVDQIHVFRSLGEDGDLIVTPSDGTLAPGASITATAQFDASTVAQPGVYSIPIRVAEDTPYPFPYGEIAGTMTVTAPPSFGAVVGTLRSLGHCDAQPQELAGVDIAIEDAQGGTYVVRTDDVGGFRYWLDAGLGPFTLTAEFDAHRTLEREVSVTAGEDTHVDLELRPLLPCLAPDPAALAFDLAAGGSATQPLDLFNLGPAEGAFTARIGGDAQIPTAVHVSQNLSPDPEAGATFACIAPNGYAMENHWYRVFPLAELGYAGETMLIDAVRFGADTTASAAGSQPVTLRLHALNGEFLLDNLSLLGETTVQVRDTPLGMLSARFDPPIEVPLDTVLVAEIAIPDGTATASTFNPAGNSAGATAPFYFASAGCGIDDPLPHVEVGPEWITLLLELDARTSDPCGAAATPVSWLTVSPTEGTVPGDETFPLAVTADAASLANGRHDAAVCLNGPMQHGASLSVPVRVNAGIPGNGPIFGDGFE